MTFAPHTRRIYVRSVRSVFGLRIFVPPHPPGLLAYTVAVQLGVPGTQGLQGTHTPKSLPDRLSPHGYQRQSRRCAPCLAHTRKRRPSVEGRPSQALPHLTALAHQKARHAGPALLAFCWPLWTYRRDGEPWLSLWTVVAARRKSQSRTGTVDVK